MGGGAVVSSGVDAARASQYNGGVTGTVITTCVIAASGGLLFGYDNGIAGGVVANQEFLAMFFPGVHSTSTTDPYCKYDDWQLQLFTSSLYLAGAFSALVGSHWTTKLGRRPIMITAGIWFLLGAILDAAAMNQAMLIIGRVCLGFGVGLANQSVPMFLAEMAPYKLRGAMNMLFQMAVVIGILIAQLLNYGIRNVSWGWRLSLGLAAVPALILSLGSLTLNDTPNSLIERGKRDEAHKVLQKIRGTDDVDMEFEDLCTAVEETRAVAGNFKTIFQKQYRPQLWSVILIPFFQQLTGINAIVFYSPQLLESVGNGSDAALLNTVIIGAVNVCCTIVAISVVDRLGRKVLFMEGGIQMFSAEVVVGTLMAIYMNPTTGVLGGTGTGDVILAFICIFVAGFAWSWGPLAWLVPSEICPIEIRSTGQAINVFVNFLFTFAIGQAFLSMLCAFKFGIFYFFAGFVVLMTIFSAWFIPETRGVPIEEIKQIYKAHWFWSKVRGAGPNSELHMTAPSDIKIPSEAKSDAQV